MTLGELRKLFRNKVGDQAQPYLWLDPEIAEFANEAEREACRRADLLVDSSTPSVCTLSIKAANPTVKLHSSVLDILRMRVQGQALTVEPSTAVEMDSGYGDWESGTGTEILHYLTDLDTASVRLYPIPQKDLTLRLTVVRLPLREMESASDEPEILARHHRKLVYWMMKLAYEKQDSETFDPDKAKRSEAEFIKEFGQSKSARNEQWQRRTAFGMPDSLI